MRIIAEADPTIVLTRNLYLGLIMEQVDLNEAAQKGLIAVKGDEALVQKCFDLFDRLTNQLVLTVR